MQERRAAARERLDENGLITVDEHTSIPCLIYDMSERGVRLVSLEAGTVPETFLLAAGWLPEVRVCEIVWRTHEEIGARFAANP
ncbi:PilZ domain-containing protein [Methylobacterium dankookense]|nr:PilZ domain-containing protein [Methylobacterium dankookense]